MAALVLELAGEVLAEVDGVDAVGIANQRGSAVVWDRATGEPVGPAHRLAGPPHGRPVPRAPRAGHPRRAQLRGDEDRGAARRGRPRRGSRPVRRAPSTRGSRGRSPRASGTSPTPRTRASPGSAPGGDDWDAAALDALRIPVQALPEVVDSSGVVGPAPRAARRAADRGRHRRPAGVAARPGRRARAATPRSRSAPARCSTSCSAPTGRRSPSAAARGRSRS